MSQLELVREAVEYLRREAMMRVFLGGTDKEAKQLISWAEAITAMIYQLEELELNRLEEIELIGMSSFDESEPL